VKAQTLYGGAQSPAVQMRETLARLRSNGLPFELAWMKAMRAMRWPHPTVDRREWRALLAEHKDEWQAAYERQPSPSRPESGPAFAALAVFLEQREERGDTYSVSEPAKLAA
jgi:hypothetical protein